MCWNENRSEIIKYFKCDKKFQSLDNRYYFKLLEKCSDIAQSVLEIRKCLSW